MFDCNNSSQSNKENKFVSQQSDEPLQSQNTESSLSQISCGKIENYVFNSDASTPEELKSQNSQELFSSQKLSQSLSNNERKGADVFMGLPQAVVSQPLNSVSPKSLSSTQKTDYFSNDTTKLNLFETPVSSQEYQNEKTIRMNSRNQLKTEHANQNNYDDSETDTIVDSDETDEIGPSDNEEKINSAINKGFGCLDSTISSNKQQDYSKIHLFNDANKSKINAKVDKLERYINKKQTIQIANFNNRILDKQRFSVCSIGKSSKVLEKLEVERGGYNGFFDNSNSISMNDGNNNIGKTINNYNNGDASKQMQFNQIFNNQSQVYDQPMEINYNSFYHHDQSLDNNQLNHSNQYEECAYYPSSSSGKEPEGKIF